MNDETERIYKELLKQYANAFKRAGEDDSEENRHSFKIANSNGQRRTRTEWRELTTGDIM